MSVKVNVQPQLLRWARERAALDPAELARKVGLKEERVTEWEQTGELTLAWLERIANKTYTPVGYLFLPAPPLETLPIPDFRTVGSDEVRRPSADLLDTIYLCQQRQEWFREYLVGEGEEPLAFVGSATIADPPAAVAARIRTTVGLESQQRAALPSGGEALTAMVEGIEAAGILVMRNGVVGNNTHRKLDVREFRGFALSDKHAPLLFVNAADSKAAQMFTLAHELGHLWLGQSGVSDVDLHPTQQSERYCNAVAAEALVPVAEFRARWRGDGKPLDQARRLAREFKVSTLVVLIRAWEAGKLTEGEFDKMYGAERARVWERPPASGGDFYRTQGSRLGKRFARAVISSTLEGGTPYKEAFRLLGVKKGETFDELARTLGVTQ